MSASNRTRTVGILKSSRDGLGADQVLLLEDNTFDDEDGGLVRLYVPNRTFCEIVEYGGDDRVVVIRFRGNRQYVVSEDDIIKQYDASDRVVFKQVIDPIIDEEPTQATKNAYPKIDLSVCERVHVA